MRTVLIWGVSMLAAGWGVALMTWGFADAAAARRHRQMREVRDWKETVQAMRRMADEEGDA